MKLKTLRVVRRREKKKKVFDNYSLKYFMSQLCINFFTNLSVGILENHTCITKTIVDSAILRLNEMKKFVFHA